MSQTPTLNVTLRANTDKFKSDMSTSTELAHSAVRRVASGIIEMNAGWLATQGAIGGATLAVGRFLPIINQVLLAYTAIKGTIDLMAYAVDLANKKIAEFNDLAVKANGTGLSTDLFQRITKSAGEARDKVDDITAALKKFNEATTDKLGGSDLQKRLDEMQKVGNASGLSIVGNDTETKLRSVVSLIDQMMDKGQRLAAVDIAGKAFGPDVARALQADSGYLDDMLKRADAMNKSQIVSPEDVGRAIELKERMDEAQKVLAEKWKPTQDDLAKLGMNYHESWVSITEDLAAAVGYATQLYTALKQVPDWFAKRIGGASIWKSITDATTTPESRAESEASLGISSNPTDIASVGINSRLAAALQNHANVTNALRQATDVQSAVRGDTSKDTKTTPDDTDAVDRAIASLQKHVSQVEADTKAVGLNDAALAKFKAQAAETAAVQANGGEETAEQAAQFRKLQDAAAAAADALAKARVANDIKFNRDTALLTSEDVSIARQLAGIYGNDVPAALASSEAAQIRFNNQLKQLGDLGQEVNRGVFVDFETQIRNGASAMDALKTAGVNALGKIADKLASMAADQLWSKALGGSGGGGILGLLGLGGGGGAATTGLDGLAAIHHTGYGPGDSFPTRTVSSSLFVGAPRYHSGVGPGERAAIIRDDESVLTPGQMRALSPANDNAPMTVHTGDTNINIQGDANDNTLAAIKAELAVRDAQLPMRVVAAVKDARARRMLA